MSQPTNVLKAFPQTTLRRLRNTPGYFFLVWRWSMWFYALIYILTFRPPNMTLATILLIVTLLQTLAVTLYAPLFAILLPRLPGRNLLRWPGRDKVGQRRLQRAGHRSEAQQRDGGEDEETDMLTPLTISRNRYWNIALYVLDVLICGIAVYLTGPWMLPFFGNSSPFYRYGLSTALVAGFTYRYRGGFAAAFGYELFILLGAFFPPPGAPHLTLRIVDLEGSLIDAPIIAILAAYVATLLNSYIRSKRLVQDDVRQQKALRSVGETLVAGASDQHHLLRSSAEQIRKGAHFERLIVALVNNTLDSEEHTLRPRIETVIEAGVVEAIAPDTSKALLEQVAQSGKKVIDFAPLPGEMGREGYGIARLYLPCYSEGRVYLLLGAESTRQTPFEAKQEQFLSIVGPQLVVAVENLRLTEQTTELATAAERGRIAREIHDGIAQLIYMLSLHTETCLALAQRISEANEEETLLAPLTERLDRLVTISKQALWETRHYMFTLKPLMTGSTTLTQMVTNQLHEFEVISGLPVDLVVEGSEEVANGDAQRTRKLAQVGTAIFRITQEALTNAYKHANATRLQVYLRHQPNSIEIEICDNGHGLSIGTSISASDAISKHQSDGALHIVAAGEQRIYSGHGLRGMRERAEELGGTFEVAPQSAGGLRVRARIPA